MHTTLITIFFLLPLQAFTLALPASSILHPRQTPTRPGSCDLSHVSQPTHTMAPPSPDMTLVLIALGRGTQNYTCAPDASAPSPIGAVATLYNASCAVATATGKRKGPCVVANSAPSIGNHFFSDNKTPLFSIPSLGVTSLKKTDSAPAPAPAQDVPWLLLTAQAAGTTSQVKRIYRLHTKGGVAPASCAGVEAGQTVTVPYEAEYWVYT